MKIPVYLIIASEYYDREKELEKFDPKPLALSDPTPQSVAEALNNRSLFAETTCVLIRDAESLGKGIVEIIADYCKNPSPFTMLVLTAAKKPPALHRAVEKVGSVVEIAPRNLSQWLTSEAQALGKRLSPDAAAELLASTGEDKALLVRELEKLACYVGEREAIEPADVASVAVGIPHETVWALRSAVMQRKVGDALAIWQELAVTGTQPLAIIALLRNQFHTCSALVRGDAHIKLPAWRRDRTLAEAKQYGLPRLCQALVTLHDAELKIKSSINVPMEMVFAELC